MTFMARIFFVVYRCHTCGNLTHHTRFSHWLRRIFGTAKQASLTVLNREPEVESQASDFKPVKPDRNPVFREKLVECESIKVSLDPTFDPDPIVKEIKSNYTASQRELMASKFREIAVMITPPNLDAVDDQRAGAQSPYETARNQGEGILNGEPGVASDINKEN